MSKRFKGKIFKSSRSAQGRSNRSQPSRGASVRQEGPKTFKIGEIEFLNLDTRKIIQWLADTEHILEVNDLWMFVDPDGTKIPTPKAAERSLTGSTDQKKLQLAMASAQNVVAKEEKEKHALAYALHFQAIPAVYRMAWTKGITNARELRIKIQEMCSFKKDTLLKLYYRNQLDSLRLASFKLLDMSNYENSFLEIVQDYIDAGGTITMDEQVAMLRKGIFSITHHDPVYRKEFIDCMLIDGPHMVEFPSTRGWSFEDIMKRLKDRNYAESGPEHQRHSNYDTNARGSKNREKSNASRTSVPMSSSRRVTYDKRADYNQKDRSQLRDSFRAGVYGHRENPRKAFSKMKGKYNASARINRSNSVQSNFTKKRFTPSKNTNYSDRKGNTSNATNSNFLSSTPNHYGPGGNNSNSDTVHPNKGILKKKATDSRGSWKNSVRFAAKKGPPKNDRPYTQPINCPICSEPHYHYNCPNYAKNKDAKPKSSKTMLCLSCEDSEFDDMPDLLSAHESRKLRKQQEFEKTQGPLWNVIYDLWCVKGESKEEFNERFIRDQERAWEELVFNNARNQDSIKNELRKQREEDIIKENKGHWSTTTQSWISKDEQNRRLASFWVEQFDNRETVIKYSSDSDSEASEWEDYESDFVSDSSSDSDFWETDEEYVNLNDTPSVLKFTKTPSFMDEFILKEYEKDSDEFWDLSLQIQLSDPNFLQDKLQIDLQLILAIIQENYEFLEVVNCYKLHEAKRDNRSDRLINENISEESEEEEEEDQDAFEIDDFIENTIESNDDNNDNFDPIQYVRYVNQRNIHDENEEEEFDDETFVPMVTKRSLPPSSKTSATTKSKAKKARVTAPTPPTPPAPSRQSSRKK